LSNKIVSTKNFYHLPKVAALNSSSRLKGASYSSVSSIRSNIKIKLTPKSFTFFEPILDHTKEIMEKIRITELTQEKMAEALKVLQI
jgi:hypothetical protein